MDALQSLKFIESLLVQLKLTRQEHEQIANALNIISSSIAKPIDIADIKKKSSNNG